MSYALSTLWYERQRYLPAVLAVAFSCLLIALQCGLLLGLFSITSIPIDESSADIWVGPFPKPGNRTWRCRKSNTANRTWKGLPTGRSRPAAWS